MTAKTTAGVTSVTAPPISSGPRRKLRAGGGPPRVLLVEDNPVDVARVEESLGDGESAYDVVHAGSAADAERLLADEAFDVVVLDLGLPDGEELAALATIHRAAAGTPIVVLTAREDPRLARRCIEEGADDYVEKGELHTPHLRRAVGQTLARSKARELRERLEHSDRLAAIGRLAVSVAHEINNPVTFITMNQELLLRRLESLRAVASAGDQAVFSTFAKVLAEMQEMLLENVVGVERISAIIRDLRTLSRQEPDELAPVDPVASCKAACTIVANHVRHHARLETRFESVSKVLADGRKLEQVVINLLMNAVQAMPQSSSADGEVSVSTYEQDGCVIIAVRDNGAGMSPRVRERVFEPFFSTKAREEGTGLGLSVSAEIVASFGGEIRVESEPGRGSTFSIFLPRHDETWKPPEKVPATRPPAVHRRRRVLLVDDDPRVLTALSRSLASAHDVVTAESGRAALALLEQDSKFDAVLCDLTMPDLDGVAVHAEIAARFPDLLPRFVAVTGGAITERAEDFVEKSGARVVTKPVGPELLLKTIDQVTRG